MCRSMQYLNPPTPEKPDTISMNRHRYRCFTVHIRIYLQITYVFNLHIFITSLLCLYERLFQGFLRQQNSPIFQLKKARGIFGRLLLIVWKLNGQQCQLDLLNLTLNIRQKTPIKFCCLITSPQNLNIFRRHFDLFTLLGSVYE